MAGTVNTVVGISSQCRQPIQKGTDQLIRMRESHVEMAKQCLLHGKAQPVSDTAPAWIGWKM
jgi:hypothetical protein